MKLERIKKLKKQFKKYPIYLKIFFIFVALFSVILFLLLVVVLFGIDQKFLNISATGVVMDAEGLPIKDVEVGLQGMQTSSDEDGRFEFSDLRYGHYPIEFSKNGFIPAVEYVTIRRSSNNFMHKLEQLEYGVVNIKFVTEDKEVNYDEFKLELNNNLINLEENLDQKTDILKTDELLIGKYSLSITSPHYTDKTEEFNIAPGESELEVNLEEASNIVFEVYDFLTQENIEPDSIVLKSNGEEIELDKADFENGKVNIQNLSVDQYSIIIVKDGYKKKNIDVDEASGIQALGRQSLVKNGKIAYLLGNELLISDYSGENLKKVKLSSNCIQKLQNSTKVTVTCGKEVYIYSLETGELVADFLLPFSTSIHAVDLETEKLYFIENGSVTESSRGIIDILGSIEEEITSVVIIDNNLVYSTNDGVYKVGIEDFETNKVFDGRFLIENVSSNGLIMVVKSVTDTLRASIWIVNTEDWSKSRVTFQTGVYDSPVVINEEDSLFIDLENKNELILVNGFGAKTTTIDKEVLSLSQIIDFGAVFVNSQQEAFLLYSTSEIPVKIN